MLRTYSSIMSVIFQSSEGFSVCHKTYLNALYKSVLKEDSEIKLSSHQNLFLVKTPYMKDREALKKVKNAPDCRSSGVMKRKFDDTSSDNFIDKKIFLVKDVYERLLKETQQHGYFTFTASSDDITDNNKEARMLAEKLYKESFNWLSSPFNGENNTDDALIKTVGSELFVFPPHCKFYCHDVQDMVKHVDSLEKFDMILLDPPWWNKYIRRKKAKCLQEGYKMMYNNSFEELPINELLAPGGIIAVWCTNSKSNLEELRAKLFPSWGTQQIAQWTWMKVTQSGHPVCPFSDPPGKQPFEQLVFGVRSEEVNARPRPEDGKVFMSVPSAIHSHKPPITEMMRAYLPSEPRCLEIFARYLLPNWTSWGLEVLKLQHLSLFVEDKVSTP